MKTYLETVHTQRRRIWSTLRRISGPSQPDARGETRRRRERGHQSEPDTGSWDGGYLPLRTSAPPTNATRAPIPIPIHPTPSVAVSPPHMAAQDPRTRITPAAKTSSPAVSLIAPSLSCRKPSGVPTRGKGERRTQQRRRPDHRRGSRGASARGQDAASRASSSLHKEGHRAPLDRDGLNGGSARMEAAAGDETRHYCSPPDVGLSAGHRVAEHNTSCPGRHFTVNGSLRTRAALLPARSPSSRAS